VAEAGTDQMDKVVESTEAGENGGTSAPAIPLYRDTNSGGYRAYLPDHSDWMGIVRRVYLSPASPVRRWVAVPKWGIPELPPCKTRDEAALALWEAWQRAFVALPASETDWEHDDLCRAVQG